MLEEVQVAPAILGGIVSLAESLAAGAGEETARFKVEIDIQPFLGCREFDPGNLPGGNQAQGGSEQFLLSHCPFPKAEVTRILPYPRQTAKSRLDSRSYRPIWLSYAGCNRSGVLRILAEKVGLELNRKGLPPLHKLQRHLALLQKEPGSPFPVIVVDDAQHLEVESIMDLCAILAHPDEQKALASLVLVGDESLDQILRLESRRAIASRMACTFRMEALTQDETKALLARRLETAKAPKDLFADDAMELLAAQSRGNRRELMNLGVMLCIEAHSREEKSITAELVLAKAPMQ